MIIWFVLAGIVGCIVWAYIDACKPCSGFKSDKDRRDAEGTAYWDAGYYPTTQERGGE